jgi:hypothetical protein
MSKPVAIGLHITKCAGTTLARHVLSRLKPNAVYLCSSFDELSKAATEHLVERLSVNEIRFVFGHYVHESLHKIFVKRPQFWFTGVREPLSRAVSEYYQICKVRGWAGLPPITAETFLSSRRNTLCQEFLRAFPTIAQGVPGTESEKAMAIVQMFDLIYGMEDFTRSSATILKQIDVSIEGMVNENTREIRATDADFLSGQQKILEQAFGEYFDQDIILYEHIRPHLGELHPFRIADGSPRSQAQLRWWPEIENRSAGMNDFIDHLAIYYVSEYVSVGRQAELVEQVSNKLRFATKMSNLLEWERLRL